MTPIIDHKNIALSVTLGLFCFHMYVVKNYTVVKNNLRTPAATGQTCKKVTDLNSDEHYDQDCVFIIETTPITDSEFEHKVVLKLKPSDSVEMITSDPDPDPFKSEFNAEGILQSELLKSKLNEIINELLADNSGFQEGASVTGEGLSEHERLVKSVEDAVEKYENFKSSDNCEYNLTKMEEAGALINSVERLKRRHLGYEIRERSEESLLSLENLLDEIEEGEADEADDESLLKCHVARANEGDISATDELEIYQRDILPLLRDHFAEDGSIDGVEGLKELAQNTYIQSSLSAELNASNIAKSITQNQALKLRLTRQILSAPKDHPGIPMAQEELKKLNAEIENDKNRMLQIPNGFSLSHVDSAQDAVNYWSVRSGIASNQDLAFGVGGDITSTIVSDILDAPLSSTMTAENSRSRGRLATTNSTSASDIGPLIEKLRIAAQQLNDGVNQAGGQARAAARGERRAGRGVIPYSGAAPALNVTDDLYRTGQTRAVQSVNRN